MKTVLLHTPETLITGIGLGPRLVWRQLTAVGWLGGDLASLMANNDVSQKPLAGLPGKRTTCCIYSVFSDYDSRALAAFIDFPGAERGFLPRPA